MNQRSVVMRLPFAVLLLGLHLCARAADETAPAPNLFGADEALQLVLEAPLHTLVRNRKDRPRVPGTLAIRNPDGTEQSVPVEVRPRGKSRLEECSFPPLRLDFKRKQVESTLFHGQKRLKLVTHCKNSPSYRNYVHQEYAIYRAYRLVEPEQSFRVRFATIEYRDTDGRRRTQTEPAFFIEHTKSVEKRLDMEEISVKRVETEQLRPKHASTYMMFQYMIGNTDWSTKLGPGGDDCCHNTKVFAPPGQTIGVIALPYDFDQAGLINKADAEPSPSLPIRSVRQRLYRGFCSHNDLLDDTIAKFKNERAAIEALFASEEFVESSRKSMHRYLNEFYNILNDPDAVQKKIVDRCRS